MEWQFPEGGWGLDRIVFGTIHSGHGCTAPSVYLGIYMSAVLLHIGSLTSLTADPCWTCLVLIPPRYLLWRSNPLTGIMVMQISFLFKKKSLPNE